jgi:hypothetical protein
MVDSMKEVSALLNHAQGIASEPADVLDMMRDVLTEFMDDPQGFPEFRVESARFIGRHSGRIISDEDVRGGRDLPGGMHLVMRDGAEYLLFLAGLSPEESLRNR